MNYIDAAFAPLRKTGQIKLYGPEAFAGMRKAGQLVADCLDQLCDVVKPGVPTEVIDKFVFDFAMDQGARPATLMYRGYNRSTCTSINHVVCHGIPNDKPLKEGDIVNIDRAGEGIVLKPGMLFTIEPMINLGRPHVKVLSDGWTAVTRDRSLSAQFEHTVGVTADGAEVFTISPAGRHKPPY